MAWLGSVPTLGGFVGDFVAASRVVLFEPVPWACLAVMVTAIDAVQGAA